MGVDRWNRVRQRPHIVSVAGDNDSEPQEIIEGGAYDSGLPLAVPASRNTRQYRRTIARTIRVTRSVTAEKASVTYGQVQDKTGPVRRESGGIAERKPPVTGRTPGANRSASVTGAVTTGANRTPVQPTGRASRSWGPPIPAVLPRRVPASRSSGQNSGGINICALDHCDKECRGTYCSNAHKQKAYRIRKATASVERIEQQELAKARRAAEKGMNKR
jgi:hypothetical protein